MTGPATSGAAWDQAGAGEELGDGKAGHARGVDPGQVGKQGNRSRGHGGVRVPGGFPFTFC